MSIMSDQYEVLSPWAEKDPVPLRGISERLKDLSGMTIGLHADNKPAAVPILKVVEKRVQEQYPTAKTTWFKTKLIDEIDRYPEVRARFLEWAKGVDAVVGAVGD
jgi:hypothetical protein